MVGQSVREDAPVALTDDFKMERSEDSAPPSDCGRPATAQHVETTRVDTEQMMSDDVADTSDVIDTGQQSLQPHQLTATDHQPGGSWLEIPSLAITYSFQTSTSQSAAVSPPGGRPRRILPLTKYSATLTSRDVAGTSPAAAAAAAAAASRGTSASAADFQTYHVKPDVRECASVTPASSTVSALSSLAADTSQLRWSFPRDIDASAAVVPSTTYEHSTIAIRDAHELGLTAAVSSSFSSVRFHPATQQEWPCPQGPDSFEFEAKRRRGSADQPWVHQIHVADTSVFRKTSEASSESEVEAASTHDSPHASGFQSSDSPKSETELVQPLTSLHIDTDVGAARRRTSERRRRRSGTASETTSHRTSSETRTRVTHPGCSTLRYNRKHNPGLHRPRTFLCTLPGRHSNITSSPSKHLHCLKLLSLPCFSLLYGIYNVLAYSSYVDY